jgi:hypothetical protein
VDSDELVKQGEEYGGFSPAAYGAPAGYQAPAYDAAPALPVQAQQFRPLSTGEVLDRTFSLYRQRFWLFAGIGMLPAGILVLSGAIRLLYTTLTHQSDVLRPGLPGAQSAAAMSSLLLMQVYLLPATVLFLIAYGVSHAATVDAVNRLGQGAAASVRIAYDQVRGRWVRWCGIVLRQFWSMVWPVLPGLVLLAVTAGMIALPSGRNNMLLAGGVVLLATAFMVAGSVLGIINFIRNTLAVAAGVSENLGVNAAMRRSKMLTAGHKGRLFLAWLLVYALQMVVAAVQMPLLFAAMTLRGGAFVAVQAVVMLVQFVAVALVTPVASIAFTLFYIDERVRREGLDIELLMRRTLPGSAIAHAPEV